MNANITKKRLECLAESVLKSIQEYCDYYFGGDDIKFCDVIEIKHNGQPVGMVDFRASYTPRWFNGCDLTLHEIEVKTISGNNCHDAVNIKALLNDRVQNYEGEILNF